MKEVIADHVLCYYNITFAERSKLIANKKHALGPTWIHCVLLLALKCNELLANMIK